MLCKMSAENPLRLRMENGRPAERDGVVSMSGSTACIDISEDAVILLDMHFDSSCASDVRINLHDGCEAYIIEELSGADTNLEISPAVHINVGKNSTLKHQVMCGSMLSVGYHLTADVAEKGIFADYQSYLGINADCKSEINLNGYGSSSSSQLIALTADSLSQKHDITVNHLSKSTRSRMTNRGAALGSSKCVIDCVGFIKKGSSAADAYQKSRIITLSDAAKAHVSPALIIDEYDVSAGHSGSVGSINAEELYYLQSRGIDKAAAAAMCAAGFLLGAADPASGELYSRNEEEIKRIISSAGI